MFVPCKRLQASTRRAEPYATAMVVQIAAGQAAAGLSRRRVAEPDAKAGLAVPGRRASSAVAAEETTTGRPSDVKPLLQGAVSGLLIGGIYALIALGLNIVFGTMRVVNFAQGTLLMAAMFMAYWLHELDGPASLLSPLVTVPLLFGLGYAIQRAF